ncbi:mechanosensitive ion channel family protein [Xenophilus arseniciresistens]|uniref:Mechanosensitive ion channel family protein n=1 Tax=Xenophilus arseniciresistens TaxID=1283306 RepID=A0AAE3SZV5_9BURK|nr:mechanosensitive ion channel family protein [Xenophilus arseniciresistens]MDA7417514.1 mechanosensitive ion channel family protein [Xenophilus arseniciresistens]
MNRLSLYLSEHLGLELWVASLLVIALATFLVNFIAQALLSRVERISGKTQTVWDDALVQAARSPLRVLVWVVGLDFMASVLQRQVDADFIQDVRRTRDVLAVICVSWFLLRFARLVGHNVEARRRGRGEEVDTTTFDALVKLACLVVVVVAVITVAQTLGFQISGLLALGGVGGIAVGFAAKDLLANFFGGLTIYLDRPFSVGDWIRSPDKAIEGSVEYISWRHTRIRGFNKNPIYVPNSVFTNIVVENPSRMTHRRLRETIGVRFKDFGVVEAIVHDIRAMLAAHEAIDNTQTTIVNLNAFGPSSLEVMVYAFTTTTAWVPFQHIKQDVLLRIGRIVAAHGAEIALPTQTVRVDAQDETPALLNPA